MSLFGGAGNAEVAKIDEDLIQTSAALTEDPVFIQGEFQKRFLELPEEILATSMKKHQNRLNSL